MGAGREDGIRLAGLGQLCLWSGTLHSWVCLLGDEGWGGETQGRGTVGRLCMGLTGVGLVGGTRTIVGVGVLEWGWGWEGEHREQGVATKGPHTGMGQ